MLKFIVLLSCIFTWLNAVEQNYIWIEGEAAAEHNMRGHSWYDDVHTSALSGSNWLSNFAKRGDNPEARFEFSVSQAGSYNFWIRANPSAGAQLQFQFNNDTWQDVPMNLAQERVNIASDAKPDMRFIAWLPCAPQVLQVGTQELRVRFLSQNHKHGAIDCFLLTQSALTPQGAQKPGERSGRAQPGFVAWEPQSDSYSDDALLDLRYLNEDIAGQEGWIVADGEHLRFPNGKEAKFWGTNMGPALWSSSDAQLAYLAKLLAKRGVNTVRLHGSICSQGYRVDQEKVRSLARCIGHLRNEGIYSQISFYFPLWFKSQAGSSNHPFGEIFFSEDFQIHYRSWLNAILQEQVPGGKNIAQEPAVLGLELVNEDSLYFWTNTNQNISGNARIRFEKLFYSWVLRKYQSISAAYLAWGSEPRDGDNSAAQRLYIFDVWNMTAQGNQQSRNYRKRLEDQSRFFAETMQQFYDDSAEYIRKQGYKGLISYGNWKTADPQKMDFAEAEIYAAGDIMDRHGYFSGPHTGQDASWSVRPGHEFASLSALSLSKVSPIIGVEYAAKPSMISEIGWPRPNRYGAEGVVMIAAYGALLGLDVINNFASDSTSWSTSMSKFGLHSPARLGQFSAAALLFRQGIISEAEVIAREIKSRDAIFRLESAELSSPSAFDALRAVDVDGRAAQELSDYDVRLFHVGRVQRISQEMAEKINVKKVGIPSQKNTQQVADAHRQLVLDPAQKLLRIETERAQGLVGFITKEMYEFSNVILEIDNEYASVLIVSLDGQTLRKSNKILVQIMTEEELFGFKASEGESGIIRSVGSAPWGFAEISGSLTWKGPKVKNVIALDENGYAREIVFRWNRKKQKLTFEADSWAYILER